MTSNKIIDETEINDIRQIKDFKIISFSNYKKSEVKIKIINELKNGKIESVCYWAAELICAGHYYDLWDIIIFFVSKYIHIGNPKIIIYLEKRFIIFKNIIEQGFFVSIMDLRNNQTIRNLFAEIICVLSLSNKKNSFETIKINKIEEFDISQLSEIVKAQNIYIQDFFKKKDPKEFFIALNEFAFSISKEKHDIASACYWIEWIIEFNNLCISQKKPCLCEKREYEVEKKYKYDVIWIIWDILLYESNKCNNFINTIIKSILFFFCIKYTTASSKKKKYLLYFAIELIIQNEKIPENLELITEKNVLKNVLDKINCIYQEIKKNEIDPGTDYLFNGIKKNDNNFEKSIEKMEIMNSF
jgi:hypothetical protein